MKETPIGERPSRITVNYRRVPRVMFRERLKQRRRGQTRSHPYGKPVRKTSFSVGCQASETSQDMRAQWDGQRRKDNPSYHSVSSRIE